MLTSNQTYYVTMGNGIVEDATGCVFRGRLGHKRLDVTTKPAGPANPTNLVVAIDGTGDFVTVQGAVDSIARATPIHRDQYSQWQLCGNRGCLGQEQHHLPRAKPLGTVVGYPNNNNINGTTAARMAFKVNASDIHLENLTITNGTPQGGSQAEALLIYNNGLRCVVDKLRYQEPAGYDPDQCQHIARLLQQCEISATLTISGGSVSATSTVACSTPDQFAVQLIQPDGGEDGHCLQLQRHNSVGESKRHNLFGLRFLVRGLHL